MNRNDIDFEGIKTRLGLFWETPDELVLAALGVFGTGTGWPDIIVAFIMGGLGLHGGTQIVRHALAETASRKVELAA